jgi:acyl carrier protein
MSGLNGSVASQVTDWVRATFLYARPDFDLAPDLPLLERGVVDSTGVVELVEFLQDAFKITVADDEITEENLGTIGAIARYVAARQAEMSHASRTP